jgi:ribosomal protein L34E
MMMNKSEKPILVEASKCPKCGASFHCSTSNKCWCYEFDVPSDKRDEIEEKYQGCLCPNCLKEFAK